MIIRRTLRSLLPFALFLCPLAGQGSALPRWRPVPDLFARGFGAVAYDEARQRLVMFGGGPVYGGVSVSMNDTWEWDGMRWALRHPRHVPTPRHGHAMVFDPTRQRVVLYGGATAPMQQARTDMWEWDGSDWLPITYATQPTAVFRVALAPDPVRRTIVLFGGSGFVTGMGWFAFDETWEWDGQDWRQVIPSGGKPSHRLGGGMAYCANTSRVTLYGGLTPSGGNVNDALTWEWDGAAWVARSAYPGQPSTGGLVQQDPLMAACQWSGRVWMHGQHGGWTEAAVHEWDGVTWTQLARSGAVSGAPVRGSVQGGFDAVRRQYVLFSGAPYPAAESRDTWICDSAFQWRKLHEPPFPRGGYQGVVYDAARDEYLVLVWDTITWPYPGRTLRLPGAAMDTSLSEATNVNQPPRRTDTGLCFDPISGCVLMYGGGSPGQPADCWLWDGNDWTQQTTPPLPTPGIGSPVFNSRSGEVVMPIVPNDGSAMQTWGWTRARGWRRIQHQTALPRYVYSGVRPRVAYDSARDRLVLVRDSGASASTWTFDGFDWRRESPPSGTPANGMYQALNVPELGGVVLIVNDDILRPDSHQIWLWTGTDWRRVPIANWPGDGRLVYPWLPESSVFMGRFVYDSSRGKVRMFMDPGPAWLCEDLLVDRLTVNSTGPRVGTSWTATVRDPARANGVFFLALSAGEWPGVPFRWRSELGVFERIPLANDWLFQACAAAGLGFGLLDATGTGSFSLALPNDPALIGFRFHAAAVTVDPTSLQLAVVTNPVTSEIQR